MCLAIPGKVVKLNGRQATVQYPGETRQVIIGENGVKIGSYVMVQMGIIIKVLKPKEAKEVLAAWK
jgi:hydrogenase expression/formation protein HypC